MARKTAAQKRAEAAIAAATPSATPPAPPVETDEERAAREAAEADAQAVLDAQKGVANAETATPTSSAPPIGGVVVTGPQVSRNAKATMNTDNPPESTIIVPARASKAAKAGVPNSTFAQRARAAAAAKAIEADEADGK